MGGYKKYYSWESVIRRIIKSVPKKFLGGFIFARLMNSDKETHYLVLPRSLGDSILTLSYATEYKKQKKINHITAVCTPYVQRLCSYYPKAIDDVICKKRWKIIALREFISSTILGQHLYMLYRNKITFAFYSYYINICALWNNMTLNFPFFAKAVLYRISMSSEPERPQVPQIDLRGFEQKYDLKRDMTVFFNPTANSVRCDITGLLNAVALELKQEGYKVVTLMSDDSQIPIPGTQGIPCNLEEAYSLVEYGGTLIGLRSGFMDFLVYANCRVIVVQDTEYGLKDFYLLENLGVNKNCHTIDYDGNDDISLCKIIELMEIGDKEAHRRGVLRKN